MGRVWQILLCCHLSLAMALATVAVLAVPQTAFGDISCAITCATTHGTGNQNYWNCVAACCDADQLPRGSCCTQYCDPNDPQCVEKCTVANTCAGPGICNNLSDPCVGRPSNDCTGVATKDYCLAKSKDECSACACQRELGDETKCTCRK